MVRTLVNNHIERSERLKSLDKPKISSEAREKGVLVNLPPRAEREAKKVMVNLRLRVKREAIGLLLNLHSRAKREAKGS